MNPHVLAFAALIVCASVLTAGCSSEMTEQSVREFVDAADRAFLEGRPGEVCAMRAANFRLNATEFKLAGTKIVSGLAQAEAVAADRHEAGELIRGDAVKLDHQEFCRMAYEAHDFFKRAKMERTDLRITLDQQRNTASVRAHYTIWEPVYEHGESPLGFKDQVEIQTATKQTEVEDESVVILDEDGEHRFVSTVSVGKSFHVAKQRDRRL